MTFFAAGVIVDRLARMFIHYDERHSGRINYRAGGGECRMGLPGMVSDRHPDQAIYLDPEPSGHKVWTKWVPHIVMAEPIFYDDFVKLELRVATVLEARPHPNADKLLLSS